MPYDPAIQLLGTYPLGMGACVHQGTQPSNGHSSIVLNCQTPRKLHCLSTVEETTELWFTYTTISQNNEKELWPHATIWITLKT